MPEDDNTMYVLTMVLVSLQRIISTVDRVTLEREHTNIIDNLNIYRIGIAPDVRGLVEEVLQVISKRRLDDEIRQIIANAESEQVRRSPWRRFIDNSIKSFIDNPKGWFEQPVFSSFYAVASMYQEYRSQQDDSTLKLTPEERHNYGELRNRLLRTLRQLPYQEGLGLGGITQGVLRAFTEAIKFKKPLTRQTKLEAVEDEFSDYAPYWFHRAQASLESGDNEMAGKYFARFMEVWRPVLFRDPYMAEAMKYEVAMLMREGVSQANSGEIVKCFKRMRANAQLEDWTNNIFVGMMYFSLGDREKAEAYVMSNIESELECEKSRELLEHIRTAELPARIEPLSDEAVPVRVHEPVQNVHEIRPPMSDDDFLELCKGGEVAKIEEAINNGANVNAVSYEDHRRDPVLTWATKKGHTEVVKILLKKGAEVNAKNLYGSTALMLAARKGYPEVAEILLQNGAKVNDRNNYGSTALLWAAKYGNIEVIEVLLNNGADINAKANNGFTALIRAAMGNHLHIAEILLEHGADVNSEDNWGWTALRWAERCGYANFTRLLREHATNLQRN